MSKMMEGAIVKKTSPTHPLGIPRSYTLIVFSIFMVRVLFEIRYYLHEGHRVWEPSRCQK
eukprot:COSAG01_NODE_60639_length_293_cov_1.572165_1_plen_59_part_10